MQSNHRLIRHGMWATIGTVACLWLIVAPGHSQEQQQAAPAATAEEKPAEEAAKKEELKKEDAKTDGGEKDKDKPAPANPFSRLIRNVFGGNNTPNTGRIIPKPGEDGEPLEGDSYRPARDHIDSRAPYDTAQSSRLRKARALMEDEHWKPAARWLQRILDHAEQGDDALVQLPDGRLQSVREHTLELLGQFPPEALESYRLQHGGTARQILKESLADGDLAGITEVADTYFHTEAGYQACNYLAGVHFDRSEFVPAARRYRRLLQHKAPITRDANWRLKAALAFRKADHALAESRQTDDLTAELLAGTGTTVRIGGAETDPQGWLEGQSVITRLQTPVLDDWPLFFGTPARTATTAGGEPLLLERWRRPLTYSQPVRDQIELLVEDLDDEGVAAIPAWFPLMVDDKVIFRTFRGVQVVDARSGEPLWETADQIPAEALLTGYLPSRYDLNRGPQPFMAQVAAGGIISNYRRQGAQQHPLTGFLLRNGTYGILGSDGERLFVLEDHAVLSRQRPGYYGSYDANQNDPFRRDWSSNKLTAYDLQTGRPLWSVGGTATNDLVALPLAGSYFFGTPVSDGNTLYAVAERQNEVRLHALDPETGAPRWSQLLAISEAKIDKDYGRRWWNAQVAVKDGVLVCPTTLGWLVGVDRASHCILWSYRYSKPARSRGNSRRTSVVQYSGPSQRWRPSAPVIADGRVVYTPQEYTSISSNQASLVCLSLADGRRLWTKSKGSYLYLAGVFGNRVLLVGNDSVAALSLQEGSTLWTRPLSGGDRPSGYGACAGGRYYLPLRSGQLWAIDLQDGEVASKNYLPDDETRLGNLGMYQGMLLSLGPQGVTSFEQRESVAREIARRKADDPNDAWALLREADIHVVRREYEQALASLRRVDETDLAEDQREHYRTRMIDSLAAVIREDFQSSRRELDELAEFVRTPDERLRLQRLKAERLAARGEFEAAFEVHWELALEERSEFIPRADDDEVAVRCDRWLSGAMRDLWPKLPAPARESFSSRLQEASTAVREAGLAERERFVRLFGFHPVARSHRRALAEQYASDGRLGLAEAHLLELSRVEDAATASQSLYRLAELMQEHEMLADARYFYRRLARRFPDVEVAGGKTGRRLFEELSASDAFAGAARARRADWGNYDLEVQHGSADYSYVRQQELDMATFRAPYLQQFRYDIEQQQRLALVSLSDGSLDWLLPLRSRSGTSGNAVAAVAAEHLMFLLHRDVLHCVSPLDRRVLWSHTLQSSGRPPRSYRFGNQYNTRPMRPAANFQSGHPLLNHPSGTSALAIANSNYVCIYGRREFTVLDAATGEVRWRRGRVPPNARLYGNRQLIYMVPPDQSLATAFRAVDGKPLDASNAAAVLQKTIQVTDGGLVLFESNRRRTLFGFGSGGSTVVRLHDPEKNKDRWQRKFDSGAYFSMLDEGTLAVLRKDGRLTLLDLDDGRLQELGNLPEEDVESRSNVYVLADWENVYVIANQRRRSGVYYSMGLPSIYVNGFVFAYDRRDGGRLWKQTVKKQSLVLYRLCDAPALTFASRQRVREGNLSHYMASLVVLDKATGRKLVETTSPYRSTFQRMTVDLADRYIELRSYNSRIRMLAVERKQTAAQPEDSQTEK